MNITRRPINEIERDIIGIKSELTERINKDNLYKLGWSRQRVYVFLSRPGKIETMLKIAKKLDGLQPVVENPSYEGKTNTGEDFAGAQQNRG